MLENGYRAIREYGEFLFLAPQRIFIIISRVKSVDYLCFFCVCVTLKKISCLIRCNRSGRISIFFFSL